MNILVKCNCGLGAECWHSWSIWESGQSRCFDDEPWSILEQSTSIYEKPRSQCWSNNSAWSIDWSVF